jgi:hypothetical protein
MDFADLVDFHCMQIGRDSLEQAYEHFVHDEPYGLSASRPSSSALGTWPYEPAHQAIFMHLAAFKSKNITAKG